MRESHAKVRERVRGLVTNKWTDRLNISSQTLAQLTEERERDRERERGEVREGEKESDCGGVFFSHFQHFLGREKASLSTLGVLARDDVE